ncbi:MAG: ATP synthase F1 subunit delta [Acidobacteriaceae bacterium]|nr:ATP synthase F1 subunit delta [Acidobacteriaceae bacterium]MBV9295321.1 ATP synthase F1 subunit delta [Acidobacteriaceae bacterium]MBV9765753.1 ATP synthase F1 subunit delta [Acidobacteriaceae bacterium]
MRTALAAHYACALADAVFAPNAGISPQDAVIQLRAAESLVSGSKDLERALLSPAVTQNRKKAIVSRLADELGLHRLLRNFLLVLISHRRTSEFPAIRQEFELVVDERLGWIPAEITSARELNAQQREQIERVLGTKLGKFIRAHYKVDPAILAGVRARVASREYDATLRGKLDSMRQRLTAQL